MSCIVPYQVQPVFGISPSQPVSQSLPNTLIAQIPSRLIANITRVTTPGMAFEPSLLSRSWMYAVPKIVIILREIKDPWSSDILRQLEQFKARTRSEVPSPTSAKALEAVLGPTYSHMLCLSSEGSCDRKNG